jgi:hypothetical protein
MNAYNSSIHRSIATSPKSVTRDVEHELWLKQEEKGPQKVTNRKPAAVFNVGDVVRLSKAKKVFDKGYLPNWTEEIFTVTRVLNTAPVQYKVQDSRMEEIEGSFYAAELQKVVKPEAYAIERVIRTRRVRGRRQYYVKWLGYGAEHNSWVNNIEGIA